MINRRVLRQIFLYARHEHPMVFTRFKVRCVIGQAGRLEMAQRGRLLSDDAFRSDVVLGIAARTVEYLRRVPETSSPGAKDVTPDPTASTTPETSCPVMAGSGTRSG